MALKAKYVSQYSEEELNEFSREEMIEDMDDREVAFSEYFIKDYNLNLAALKAGYKSHPARNIGNRVRRKQSVTDYIAWLKLHLYYKANVQAEDILNQYAKLAFYDIMDYVEMNGSKLKIKDFKMVDGQIIQEISQNASGGISIKFPDRIKALEKLDTYMDTNPFDWKRKIEERKLLLLENKIELERQKAGFDEDTEDDGFIEALERSALGLYDDEDEEEQAEE